MATLLDKDLIRESTIVVDGREIIVTLSAKQEILFKLKGMKSGEVKISILDLYNQLTGKGDAVNDAPTDAVNDATKKSLSVIKEDKVDKDNPMINLYDLRSLSAVSGLDVPTMVKFDGILAELIKNDKERKNALKLKK